MRMKFQESFYGTGFVSVIYIFVEQVSLYRWYHFCKLKEAKAHCSWLVVLYRMGDKRFEFMFMLIHRWVLLISVINSALLFTCKCLSSLCVIEWHNFHRSLNVWCLYILLVITIALLTIPMMNQAWKSQAPYEHEQKLKTEWKNKISLLEIVIWLEGWWADGTWIFLRFVKTSSIL